MLARLHRILRELDPPGLAAPAGMHLGLDHDRPREAFGDRARLIGCRGHIAVGHGDSRRAKQGAGLVFVEVHWGLSGER